MPAPTGLLRSRFQSTHPVWDATTFRPSMMPQFEFQSTHPVWDATATNSCKHYPIFNFNPRIPYGMRPHMIRSFTFLSGFQSTHPVWDATYHSGDSTAIFVFQSTHPVWDATALRRHGCTRLPFQSTHPVWDATWGEYTQAWDHVISIHASRMGCDCRMR